MPPKKKQVIKEEKNNEIINYYETEAMQPFLTQHHNPNYNYDTFNIKHPFPVMIVVGSTGSGKSNLILNLIEKTNGTWNNIYIWTLDASEAIYKLLKSKIDKEYLHIYEGIESFNKIPDVDAFFKNQGQTLIIFDDMCSERHQEKIGKMSIHCRKMADEHGLSLCYLSQSYFAIPKIIRLQSKYVILKKVGSDKDTKAIIRDSNVQLEPEELMNMYDYCVDDRMENFLLINKSEKAKNMFRKNFDVKLDVNDFKLNK